MGALAVCPPVPTLSVLLLLIRELLPTLLLPEVRCSPTSHLWGPGTTQKGRGEQRRLKNYQKSTFVRDRPRFRVSLSGECHVSLKVRASRRRFVHSGFTFDTRHDVDVRTLCVSRNRGQHTSTPKPWCLSVSTRGSRAINQMDDSCFARARRRGSSGERSAALATARRRAPALGTLFMTSRAQPCNSKERAPSRSSPRDCR